MSNIANKLKAIKLKSFSKINLGLWIKEKRLDGYHEIETIYFENESLFDEIEIKFLENNKLLINVDFVQNELSSVIPKEQNLAYKAVLLFFKKLGIKGHCEIKINKKIPMEAGLGGGSSNASFVLKELNRIFDYQLHESELLLLGSQIGSDVPFFILGKTCLGKGRGEKLTPLENKLNLDIKIIKPKDISISTKWAYELIDSREVIPNHKNEMDNLIKSMKQGNYDLFYKNIFNDFESLIFDKYPDLIREKEKLLTEGYTASGLCGSGSALYGIRKRQ